MNNILIADDEILSVKELDELIRQDWPANPFIKTVNSFKEAASILKRFDVHLLFINLEMPGAFNFLESIREANFLVIVTAWETPENLFAIRLLEFDYLVKPYDKDKAIDLFARLNKQCETAYQEIERW